MSIAIKKVILSALFALTMIVVTFLYSRNITIIPEFIISLINFLPYILTISIIVGSIIDKQSRELNLAVSLFISFLLLRNLLWPDDANNSTATILFVLIGPILAFNFIFIISAPEKGIINKHGLRHLYLFVIELNIVIWFVSFSPELLLTYIYYPYFDSSIFTMTPMYQSTIIINSIVFLILFANAILIQKIEIIGYLGAFIALVLAQHYINTPAVSAMFFTVVCLVLILTMALNNFRFSKIDLLTDLPSLRSFNNHLKLLEDNYCIAIVDIDDFKEILNEYGQDICNEIIRMIASRSRQLGRKGFSYRFGSGEFTIIFYDMKLNEANQHLATLCDSIANKPFLLREKKRSAFKPNLTKNRLTTSTANSIPISVSVGIAEKQEHHSMPADVLTTAQEALERVKEEQIYFAEM